MTVLPPPPPLALPPTPSAPTAVSVTLTEVLALGRRLWLYGSRVSDLVPRGDLGLGLDPEGPVGFALVRACRVGGRFHLLPVPLLLSVYGEGQRAAGDDADARPGEQVWRATVDDCALRLDLCRAPLRRLLDLACAAGADGGTAAEGPPASGASRSTA